MNGFQFTQQILEFTDFEVEPLIQLTNGYETEWLEFKAAIKPVSGIFKADEHEGDYCWNVGKALIAMAAGTGGAVILGVSETKDRTTPTAPVGLEVSGFDGDRDRFIQTLKDRVISPDQWKTARKGNWSCHFYPEVEPHYGTFKGVPVVVLLVRPVQPSALPFIVKHHFKGIDKDFLLHRAIGDCGRVEEVDGTMSISKWWADRQVDRSSLGPRFETFRINYNAQRVKDRHPTLSVEAEVVALDEALTQYRQVFRSKWERDTKSRDHSSNRHDNFPSSQFVFENNLSVWQSDSSDEADPAFDISDLEADCGNAGDRIDLNTLLDTKNRLFIFGEPGSGKTTLLRHAIHNRIKYGSDRTPLFVPLSGFSTAETLLARISAHTGLSENLIQVGIKCKRVSLILDGLNEAGSGREKLVEDLNQLLALFPMVWIAISSRTSEDKEYLKDAFTCKVPPFNRKEQRDFLQEAFRWSSERADIVLDLIHKQRGGDQLASNPLNLCLIANIDLPNLESAGRTSLYQRAFETWLERERQQMEEAGESWLLDLDEINEVLAKIAFAMRIQGVSSAILHQISFAPDESLTELQIQMVERLSQLPNFFSCNPESQSFSFAHETFQEYFTAMYLTLHPQQMQKIRQLPGKRWSVVIAMLFDFNPRIDEDFVRSLWAADPLYALYSPAKRDAFPIDLPATDPWRSLFARVMLDNVKELTRKDFAVLPPKPDDTAKSILSDEQLWQSCSRHQASLERLNRLVELGRSRFDPFGIIIKYLSRSVPSLGQELKSRDGQWKLFSLGEDTRFFIARDALPYLANAMLEHSDYKIRSAMIALSGEFSAFFADPTALSIHLWRRLISRVPKWKESKHNFRHKASAFEYSFLREYPELVSLESTYVQNEWNFIPKECREILFPHVPSVTLLEMLQSETISPSEIPEATQLWLIDEAARDVNTLIAAVGSGFIKKEQISSDIKGKFLQDKETTKLLVRHGLIHLNELSVQAQSNFFASSSVIDLIQGLGNGALTWNELDKTIHSDIRSVMYAGVVVQDLPTGKVKIDRGSVTLLKQLSSHDDLGYTDRLESLFFVMQVPPTPDSYFSHPLLAAPVFYQSDRRKALADAHLVITKVVWHSGFRAYQFTGTPVGISNELITQVVPPEGEVAIILEKGAYSAEPLSEEEKLCLLQSGRIDAKVYLIKRDGQTLDALQKYESAVILPNVDSLADPETRLNAQALLSTMSWTLQISRIEEMESGTFFFASHPSFPSGHNEISGQISQFPVVTKDVMVANVAIVPVNKECTSYRYRISNGNIVEGVMDQRKFEHYLLLMNGYKPYAASRVLAGLVQAKEMELLTRLLIQNPSAETYLNFSAKLPQKISVNRLNSNEIIELNRLIRNRPWVFTVTESGERDQGGRMYFVVEHPLFLRNDRAPNQIRLPYDESRVANVGDKVLLWIELRESEKQSKLVWRRRWEIIETQSKALVIASKQAAGDLLAGIFSSLQIKSFDFEPNDITESFIENLIVNREKMLAPKLLAQGLIGLKLGCELIERGFLEAKDVDELTLDRWIKQIDSSMLIRMMATPIGERELDLTRIIQSCLISNRSADFVQWVVGNSKKFIRNGFQQEFKTSFGASAPIKTLLALLAADLLSSDDISSEWIKNNLMTASLEEINYLIHHQIITFGDLPEQRLFTVFREIVQRDASQAPILLKQISQAGACLLVRNGTAKVQDLPQSWLGNYLLSLEKYELSHIVERDRLARNHLSRKVRQRLVNYVSLFDLIAYVRLGLVNESDTDEKHVLSLITQKTSIAILLDTIQIKLVAADSLKKFVTTKLNDYFPLSVLTDTSIDLAVRAIKLGFLRPNDFSAEKRKDFAKVISPANAAYATGCNLVAVEDIDADKLQSLVDHANSAVNAAVNFCLSGLLSPDQIAEPTKQEWAIMAAEPLVIRLIDAKLLDQKIFNGLDDTRKEQLLRSATVAGKLSNSGIYTQSDCKQYQHHWIDSDDISGICDCLRQGLLVASMIPETRARHWLDLSSPVQILNLLEAGLSGHLIGDRLPELFDLWSIEELIKAGSLFDSLSLVIPEPIRLKRVHDLMPEHVVRLLKVQVIQKSDITADVVRKWVQDEELTRHWAVMLRNLELLPDELITNHLKKGWIHELKSLSTAVLCIKCGLFSWADIYPHKQSLLLFHSNAQAAIQAVQAGIVTKEAFSDELKKRFAIEARVNEKIAHDLHDCGLIPPDLEDDNQERVQQILMNPPNTEAGNKPLAEVRSGRYTRAALLDANLAALIKVELSSQRLLMKVSRIIPPGNIGFLEHLEFPDSVFFTFSHLVGKSGVTVGDVFEVIITIGYDRKTNSPSYVVGEGVFKYSEPPLELHESDSPEVANSLASPLIAADGNQS